MAHGAASAKHIVSVASLLKALRVRAIKQLSQNFLLDENICDKFIKAAGSLENCHVLEIGPGPGSLTRSILKAKPRSLTLIEKDTRFQPLLEILPEMSSCPIDIRFGDALDTDYTSLREYMHRKDATPHPIKVIGNLPYGVATPLFFNLLRDLCLRQGLFTSSPVDMTFSFQWEVAERFAAEHGSRRRGRLSIMAQHLCHVDLAFRMPRTVFVPAPEVDSAVLHVRPREHVAFRDYDVLEALCRLLFAARRKQLRTLLRPVFPEAELLPVLASLGIDPMLRPEALSNEQVVQLAQSLPRDRILAGRVTEDAS